MAIKVNDISAVNQVPEATKTVEGDGSFKFTLASAITDADLQAKVDELLSDITAQGNRLAEHMDIREITEKLQKCFKKGLTRCRGGYNCITTEGSRRRATRLKTKLFMEENKNEEDFCSCSGCRYDSWHDNCCLR